MTSRTKLFPLLVAALAIAACDDDDLTPPSPSATDGTLFHSYVAIGNSITAGFQSGGLNDSTQREAYPVLLARQMGHAIGETFTAPFMNAPGCPPPLTNVFTQARLGGGSAIDCFLRTRPVASTLHNVAVPGAAVLDALSNLDPDSDPNALTSFFLGGRTQLEAAAEARPTFATVWLGNNDVLGSILDAADAGTATKITPVATFATRITTLLDEVDDLGVRGAVVIGVVQAGSAPYLTQGRAYAAAAASAGIPLTVQANCLDFRLVPPANQDTAWVSVPFPFGAPLFGAAAAGVPTTLDCSVPQVVSADEMLNLILTVAQYNIAAQTAATAEGFVFIDPNTLLLQLAADPTQIRPFPAFSPADPQHTTAPFGAALSRDGIHPSTSAHKLLANALIQTINTAYGTSLQPIP